MAPKGGNDSICKPKDTRILKYTIQCVQKIRKYLFCTQNSQNVKKSGNELSCKKIRSFDVAIKGANDSLCINRDARILIFNLQCVQQIRKYLFCTENVQNVNKSGNEPS